MSGFRGGGACKRIARVAAIALMTSSVLPASYAATGRQIVVVNDYGGDIAQRVRHIETLSRDGARVAIPSGYCMSACTMYLGLTGTCVGRRAVFGFHGPSTGIPGLGLPPKEFDRWSRVMASYYPMPLKSWYLATGRNRTVGYYQITGDQLIDLGVTECP